MIVNYKITTGKGKKINPVDNFLLKILVKQFSKSARIVLAESY